MKHFIAKSELWYKIYREREDGVKERLQNGTYTLDKSFAKTFYHLSDATSALIIARAKKWEKETHTISTRKSESEGIKERKSWSEL